MKAKFIDFVGKNIRDVFQGNPVQADCQHDCSRCFQIYCHEELFPDGFDPGNPKEFKDE
jgi:hypothetical protein